MMSCIPGRESLVEDGRMKYTYVPLQNSILGIVPDHDAESSGTQCRYSEYLRPRPSMVRAQPQSQDSTRDQNLDIESR
jgi:hypothetical protein